MEEITAAYNRITGQDGDWNPDVTLDALKDLARAVAANAWERGKRAGESIQRRRWSDEPNAPEPTNPYRVTEENN